MSDKVKIQDDKLSSFFEQVYAVVRLIPKGRVTSYGAIAKYLGTAKSSRMVGWAMNSSHGQTPDVPAHRVVNRNGLLSGKNHFGSPDAMEKLLKKEGVKVKNDQVQDFKKLFWDPALELEL
ncbi:MAG: cysteine methyltransferase [Bacteroidetes bacterium]|nr:MAG: cysteine methyltransferase [Bacteroidota bacterium]REK03445.1 MAG: cysteine methyltransferase [Bacteroidota bacterium]REK34443.1 MAG: cysteine methyltransferase [Bacteroidota bacterium]REK50439.1 MAG: cysteine methyltransferase [Bacteroidota bacterium]